MEVEFLIEFNAKPVPIEVKAKRGTTTTLNTVLNKSNIQIGYKFGASIVGIEGKKKQHCHCSWQCLFCEKYAT